MPRTSTQISNHGQASIRQWLSPRLLPVKKLRTRADAGNESHRLRRYNGRCRLAGDLRSLKPEERPERQKAQGIVQIRCKIRLYRRKEKTLVELRGVRVSQKRRNAENLQLISASRHQLASIMFNWQEWRTLMFTAVLLRGAFR